jgi:NADPH:quinone reductase-like Zn-dependent oxidoreductase
MIAYQRVIISKHGSPDVLRLIDDSIAPPSSGEVQVRVEAAGVGNPDLAMRVGVYPGAPKPPFTPGYDITGVIESVGDGVDRQRIGQTVVALVQFGVGGYSQRINLPAAAAAPAPEHIDAAERVSVGLNYLTAYQLLHRIARVSAGERILVHSAGGGVGTALLELGRLAGLEMYGTASARKHDLVRGYGATPIDYQREDFVDRIKALTGDGVDAAFDPIGGAHLRRSFNTLRNGGRLVCYGLQAALPGGNRSIVGFLSALIQMPRYSPFGLLPSSRGVFGYGVNTLPHFHHDDLAHLLGLLAARRIKPVIAARLPLQDAARAHELLMQGVAGKVVLIIEGS